MQEYYTLGEVVDNLQVNQIAIKVNGEEPGFEMYIDQHDNYTLKNHDTHQKVTFILKGEPLKNWIIVNAG